MRNFLINDFPNIGAVMSSKMVTDENYKPNFIFREKPSNENDSGWRIFSGFESDEYSENPNNFGIYDPKTILKIDESIAHLLLYKGIGSVWEKTTNNEWIEVFDYPLEDDFMVEHQLTNEWTLLLNNLFIKKPEGNDLMFTTGDKTVRLTLLNYAGKQKEAICEEKEQEISNRGLEIDIIKRYKLKQDHLLKIGYHIKEYDAQKDLEYHLICAFTIADNTVLQNFFYFDNEKDLEWALETWKKIGYKE